MFKRDRWGRDHQGAAIAMLGLGICLAIGGRSQSATPAPVPPPITPVWSVPTASTEMALLSQLYAEQGRYGGSTVCVRQWYVVPGGPYGLRITVRGMTNYTVGSVRWCLLRTLLQFEAWRREGKLPPMG
ncbi:MAG TPA: hypothetical protein PLS95_13765 [Thermoanaerobaculales bacterium]|nr:hypothetical protein [Thermoanaerobaculales bacterium]